MDIISEFKKVAPYIAERVKERITDGMADASIMKLIHAEIQTHFANQQQMFIQYFAFTADQRGTFAEGMYELMKPLTVGMETRWNHQYLEFVEKTGKTRNVDYMVWCLTN